MYFIIAKQNKYFSRFIIKCTNIQIFSPRKFICFYVHFQKLCNNKTCQHSLTYLTRHDKSTITNVYGLYVTSISAVSITLTVR